MSQTDRKYDLPELVALQCDRWAAMRLQCHLIHNSPSVSPSGRAALITARRIMDDAYLAGWREIADRFGRFTAVELRRDVEGLANPSPGMREMFT